MQFINFIHIMLVPTSEGKCNFGNININRATILKWILERQCECVAVREDLVADC
jgi:hypothetical protein